MIDKIHIILYFLNYRDKRAFMEIEYLMLDEILKHESSQIIYVLTHSNPNLTGKKKEEIIERINSGIDGIFENKKKNEKKRIRKKVFRTK